MAELRVAVARSARSGRSRRDRPTTSSPTIAATAGTRSHTEDAGLLGQRRRRNTVHRSADRRAWLVAGLGRHPPTTRPIAAAPIAVRALTATPRVRPADAVRWRGDRRSRPTATGATMASDPQDARQVFEPDLEEHGEDVVAARPASGRGAASGRRPRWQPASGPATGTWSRWCSSRSRVTRRSMNGPEGETAEHDRGQQTPGMNGLGIVTPRMRRLPVRDQTQRTLEPADVPVRLSGTS